MIDEKTNIKAYICSHCGEMTEYSQNKQVNYNGGCSTAFCLVVIGLLLLLPCWWLGLILLIIALFVPMGKKTIKANMCPHCGVENVLLPTKSVRGKELLKQYYDNIK